MSTTTTNYGLIKPVDADNADLKIFVGQNMDTIDAELLKRLTKDAVTGKVKTTDLPILNPDGSYTNTTNSAFMARTSATQALVGGTVTKLNFGTKTLDVLTEFDTTLGRFTAKASGIYFLSGCVRFGAPASGMSGCQSFLAFYKNGSAECRVQQFVNGAGTMSSASAIAQQFAPMQVHGNTIIKLNAGDYVEIYTYAQFGSSTTQGSTAQGYETTGYDTTFFRGIKLA